MNVAPPAQWFAKWLDRACRSRQTGAVARHDAARSIALWSEKQKDQIRGESAHRAQFRGGCGLRMVSTLHEPMIRQGPCMGACFIPVSARYFFSIRNEANADRPAARGASV
ncbi:hypothetical protein [Sorangium sp. So ce1024]|uniref:hypothetical protein n=1 Tax=Sorangium sp. So ce1024 TaxID=3133327 RepID=UPI003F098EC8